jgi:hypothetical protein
VASVFEMRRKIMEFDEVVARLAALEEKVRER